MSQTTSTPRVRFDVDGDVAQIVLARPEKRNAFDLQMLRELAEAFTRYEETRALRCAVLCAEGEHFTAGLDLAEVGPAIAGDAALFPDGLVDPLGLHGRVRMKPVVMAVQGWCLTIGIELLLAADIRVAARGTRFGQIEINRGIFPFGGATIRLPLAAGWGDAMRWLLTGDIFDAEEARRIGLVQELADDGTQRDVAMALARTVAKRAPLGVQATLASARQTLEEGPTPAAEALLPRARALMATEDAKEGVRSFVERREGVFRGE
ncbi:MAG: crotonase/enoyl-CoA hydratase family protein [Myxococcales bacterium]|nr:crotonase/enoyl-CoA hydratase family protein [Myxococcales bacterium]